jgi:hypothetical protein
VVGLVRRLRNDVTNSQLYMARVHPARALAVISNTVINKKKSSKHAQQCSVVVAIGERDQENDELVVQDRGQTQLNCCIILPRGWRARTRCWRFRSMQAWPATVMVATPIEAARSEKDPDGEGEHVQYCCFILLRRRTGDERRTGMDACTCPASPTWSLSLISSSKSSKELNG